MKDSRGIAYLCPDSWAIVNAKPSPVSSFMVQLRYLLHIPLIGAKPAREGKKGQLTESAILMLQEDSVLIELRHID